MKKLIIFSLISGSISLSAVDDSFSLEQAAQVMAKAIEKEARTACLVDKNYEVKIVVADENTSRIGMDLAISKGRAAVFFSGYKHEQRKALNETTNNGLKQQLLQANLSPTTGSLGIMCGDKLYGIGVMSEGGILSTKDAYTQDDEVAKEIIKKLKGCKLIAIQ